MTRFWVSWWSGYYADEGCTEPPFQIWESGFAGRGTTKHCQVGDEDTELSLCAVIDANDDQEIWKVVRKYFPDMRPRFCEPKLEGWTPGNRFPGFENRTLLKGK